MTAKGENSSAMEQIKDGKITDVVQYVLSKSPFGDNRIPSVLLTQIVFMIDWIISYDLRKNAFDLKWNFNEYGPNNSLFDLIIKNDIFDVKVESHPYGGEETVIYLKEGNEIESDKLFSEEVEQTLNFVLNHSKKGIGKDRWKFQRDFDRIYPVANYIELKQLFNNKNLEIPLIEISQIASNGERAPAI